MFSFLSHAPYPQHGHPQWVLIFVPGSFPEDPPTPPAASAHVARLDVVESVRDLLSNRDRSFWIACIAGGAVAGVYAGWSTGMSLRTEFHVACMGGVRGWSTGMYLRTKVNVACLGGVRGVEHWYVFAYWVSRRLHWRSQGGGALVSVRTKNNVSCLGGRVGRSALVWLCY
jgi:hypothetical protein